MATKLNISGILTIPIPVPEIAAVPFNTSVKPSYTPGSFKFNSYSLHTDIYTSFRSRFYTYNYIRVYSVSPCLRSKLFNMAGSPFREESREAY